MMNLRRWWRIGRLVGLASATLAATGLLPACSSGGGGGGGGNGGGNNPPQATLTVTPVQVSVEPEQTVDIDATVTVIQDPTVTYTLVPPTALEDADEDEVALRFGSVNAEGEFTASAQAAFGSQGAVRVAVTGTSLTATVPVLIVPPVQTVTIEPNDVDVLAGQQQQFAASAVDFFGDEVDPILVNWFVTGGIGTIDANGRFTATAAGQGQVGARVGGAPAALADVTVVGSVTGLTIRPLGSPVDVESGTTRRFEAVVSDAQNNQTVVAAEWTIDNEDAGTISDAGLFTAGTVGETATITATYEEQTATVPVRIVALLQPPGEQPFNIVGQVRGGDGAGVSGAAVVAEDGDGATVASTTSGENGRYTLWLPAGTYRIVATAGDGRVGAQSGVELPSQDVRLRVNLTVLAP